MERKDLQIFLFSRNKKESKKENCDPCYRIKICVQKCRHGILGYFSVFFISFLGGGLGMVNSPCVLVDLSSSYLPSHFLSINVSSTWSCVECFNRLHAGTGKHTFCLYRHKKSNEYCLKIFVHNMPLNHPNCVLVDLISRSMPLSSSDLPSHNFLLIQCLLHLVICRML